MIENCGGKPDISIIVPVFNTEKYLLACLDSILNQSYVNFEVIIVNDGSTGNCESMIRACSRTDKRIVYIKQKNMGLGAARNVGIAKALGRYIMFVDSDDLISKDACKILLKKSDELQTDIIVFDYFLNYQNSQKVIRPSFHANGIISGDSYLLSSMQEGRYSPSACNKFISSKILKKNRFSEGVFHEDIYFSLLILSTARRVFTLNQALYTYNIKREGSITSLLTKKNITDILTQYQKAIHDLAMSNKQRLIQAPSFKSNIVERIILEVLIKLVDNTKKSEPDSLATELVKSKFFNELALYYTCHGRSKKYKLIIRLFCFNQKFFLRGGRILYFVLNKTGAIKW